MLHVRTALTCACVFAFSAAVQAKPTVELHPGTARPGDLVRVRVRTAPSLPTGTLAGRPLSFYEVDGVFEALTGLPVEAPAGELPLEVVWAPGQPPLVGTLEVVEPGFSVRELTVAGKYVDPPAKLKRRMAADREAFARAFAQPFSPRGFTTNFAWPREAVVTAPFGDLRTFNGKKQSQHYGIDLDGRTGDPVYAANDGKVVMVRHCYAAGKTVVVHHGANLFTTYFHLSKILASAGQVLKKGDKLGRVGKTGRVTGPHLHWGVKVDGRYVDGTSVLSMDFEGAPALPAPRTER